jgi:hypothetical protein
MSSSLPCAIMLLKLITFKLIKIGTQMASFFLSRFEAKIASILKATSQIA